MAAEKEGDNLRTLSFLVMLAGGVQLVFSFVPLGAMFKGVLAVVIALSQLLLCSSLAGREKRNMEKGNKPPACAHMNLWTRGALP